MKKQSPYPIIPLKFNVSKLFENDEGTKFSPELLFLSYYGDVPSVYSLQRFDQGELLERFNFKYFTHILKTIQREVFYKDGKTNESGTLFLLKEKILFRARGTITSIYYCDESEEFARQIVRDLLPVNWEATAADYKIQLTGEL